MSDAVLSIGTVFYLDDTKKPKALASIPNVRRHEAKENQIIFVTNKMEFFGFVGCFSWSLTPMTLEELEAEEGADRANKIITEGS